MLRVYLRDHHGNVRCPAVSAVVGNHRSLRFCVSLLNGLDLILCHIHCAEYKINTGSYLFYLVYIHYNQLLNRLRHRSCHLPAAAYGLLVCLSS